MMFINYAGTEPTGEATSSAEALAAVENSEEPSVPVSAPSTAVSAPDAPS
jgi:hypothetical protein